MIRTSFDWKDLVHAIEIYSLGGESFSVLGGDIKWNLVPTFPACQSIELQDYFPLDIITPLQLWFRFNKMNNTGLDLYLEDRHSVVGRRVKSSVFAYLGSRITIENLKHPVYEEVIIDIKQNLESEFNADKNCQKYPNKIFQSFKSCDEKIVSDKMRKVFGIMPFWATKDLSEVTTYKYANILFILYYYI